MTVTHPEIRYLLSRYLEHCPTELESMAPLFHALDEAHDVVSRTEFRVGHVTAGAAVVDPAGRVLLIRHNGSGAWLLPGGHLEREDRSVLDASLRELEEETGISWRRAMSPPRMDVVPLDIDIHEIPADPAKGEPAHYHFDFCYLHRVSSTTVRLRHEEATDYAWCPVADLPAGRLATKLAAAASAA